MTNRLQPNLEIEELVDDYCRAWSEEDERVRKNLLELVRPLKLEYPSA